MKILAIDGGGIRGILAVTVLKNIEKQYKCKIADLFDVFAGTSTGAIIAAAASVGKEMEDVYEIYLQHGEKIFERHATVGLFKSIYTNHHLRKYLQDAYGETLLCEVEKPLLLPAVDIHKGKPYVHRSHVRSPGEKKEDIKLWDAVLSSCSAPVYFPPNEMQNKLLAIDGGLWANNPTLVTITEALSFFHQKLEDIHVLSIGTGLQSIPFKEGEGREWGAQSWLPFQFPSLKMTPKLLDLALHISSEAISYHCRHLLHDQYLRLNAELEKEMPFDDVSFSHELALMGEKLYEEQKKDIEEFLEKT
ncbi:CBASS cGAMP-activated phospholipase [Bacillus mesophilum]|uniref:Patatin-like phospholipase family protein n=1 Tax=Bacillus mesophilum TaxID=1071718 RepID=A0A7V7RQS6_9BACI|nr:CBASS cGAMP-activated phospholipase [Bacillus mesophilum]KAB2335851.1 patatin-like phospholipase family protein [Bacillus mesophilum]